ncbi:prepilin peptidase [Candidatus Poriferisodalis sp.]|uniref:prepilin peptidase n=1 Tax=Candidatus Poriferisodalis sp. TaxID=3101277 RepID=UPI003B01F998
MTAEILVWTAIGAWACLSAHAGYTDLRAARISRRTCWAAGVAIAVLLASAGALLGDPLRWLWTLAGAAAVALLLEVVYRWQPDKLGYGDVRLIIVNSLLAAWWGPAWPWWALLAGAVAAWPAAALSAAREGRHGRVKWAPGLAIGTGAVVAWRVAAVGPLG